MLFNPVFLVQPLVYNLPQDAAQQQQFRTRRRPQPQISVPGKLNFPHVNHDHRSPAFPGSLYRQRQHIVVFRNVGVENQDAVRLLQVPNGVSGSGVAHAPLQGQGCLRLQVGQHIHVVGTHRHPGKLLRQVKFLVGAIRGCQQREAFTPIALQSARNKIQRFLPCRLRQIPVSANEGLLQSITAVKKLHAELSLEAGLAPVGRRVKFRHNPNHFVGIIQLQVQLAAHRTVRTNRRFNPPGFLPLVVPFHQRPNRANINTGPAELTPRLQQGSTERRPHQRLARPLREADCIVSPDFLASAHATAAGDTKVVIPVVKWITDFQGYLLVCIVKGRLKLHAQVPDGIFELAAFVLGAGNATVIDRYVPQAHVAGPADVNAVARKAAIWVLRNEHLHHAAAQFYNIVGLASHPHPVRHRQGTGRRETPAAFHRHYAHTAGRKGLHSRVVAQVRDVDAGVNCRFQHHLSWLGLDLHAVNGDGNVIGH